MRAIINSSPFIALGCIDKINLLTELFSEILIPQEVYNETVINGKNNDVLSTVSTSGKFRILAATNVVLMEFLTDHLDRGESEVIALAKEIGVTTVIIDEAKGRKIARRHGLNVVGSLGILVLAKDKGLISEIKGCIEEMEHYGIRIGSELKTQVLKMAGE